MARRLMAALCLVLLLAGPLRALARPPATARADQCRCNERLCRCQHKHRAPAKPHCHFPGGLAPGQFAWQSCSDRQERAVNAQPYLPAGLIEVSYAAPVVFDSGRRLLRLPLVFPETDSPPPRLLLA